MIVDVYHRSVNEELRAGRAPNVPNLRNFFPSLPHFSPFIQIINVINNHWTTISNMKASREGSVHYMTICVLHVLVPTPRNRCDVMNMHNLKDCGLFAIACATE